jgi:hypothetical protein
VPTLTSRFATFASLFSIAVRPLTATACTTGRGGAYRYGDQVKVVGLADGGACLEDPDGLDAAELQRLVRASLPLAGFDAATLGPRGALTHTHTLEGARQRDTMHMRVQVSTFLEPC